MTDPGPPDQHAWRCLLVHERPDTPAPPAGKTPDTPEAFTPAVPTLVARQAVGRSIAQGCRCTGGPAVLTSHEPQPDDHEQNRSTAIVRLVHHDSCVLVPAGLDLAYDTLLVSV